MSHARSRRLVMLGLCGITALPIDLVSVPGRADPLPPAPPDWRPSIAIAADVGVGAPLGYAGLEARYSPIPWLTLGGGAGSNGSGVQVAAMLWVAAPVRTLSAAFGAGESMGPFAVSSFDFEDPTHWQWERAWWTNLEMSFETRWSSGVSLRWFGGLAFLDNPEDGVCAGNDTASGQPQRCDSEAPGATLLETLLPYTGISIGYEFSL